MALEEDAPDEAQELSLDVGDVQQARQDPAPLPAMHARMHDERQHYLAAAHMTGQLFLFICCCSGLSGLAQKC